MTLRQIAVWLVVSCSVAFTTLRAGHAQEAPPVPVTPSVTEAGTPMTESVTRDSLEQLKKQVEAAADLTAEQKQEANAQITAALDSLSKTDELNAAFLNYPAKTAGIEAERQQASEALQAIQRESARSPNTAAEVTVLEQELNTRQQELLQVRTALDQVEGSIVKRTERQKEIKERLVALPEALKQVETELSKLEALTEPALLIEARRLRFRAERRRLEQESPALQAETAFLAAQEAATLLQLRRQIDSAKVKHLSDEVDAWRLEVLRKKASQAQGRIALSRAMAEHSDSEQLKEIYLRNAGLAEQESTVREKTRNVERVLNDETFEFQRLEAELKEFEARELRLGASRTFGIRLRDSQHALPDPRALRQANLDQVTEIEDALTKSFNWQNQLAQLDQLGKEVERIASSIPAPFKPGDDDAGRREAERWRREAEEQVRDALTQQQDFLTMLTQASAEYIIAMDSLEARRRDLINKIRELDTYIGERVLWIPTHGWLTHQTIINDDAGFQSLTDPKAWRSVIMVLARDFYERPWLHLFALALWIGMLFTQSRQREVLKTYGKQAGSRLNTSMKPTWSTLFWTVLKSLVFPFPFLFLGKVGSASLDPQVAQLSQSTVTIAIWLWWLELVRHVCRSQGLGISHFQWPEKACRTVTTQLSSLILLSSPVLFLIGVLNARSVEGQGDGLQRISGIVFLSLLGFTLHRLTSRRYGVLQEWNATHPNSWWDRLNGLWHLLAISVPVFLAGLLVAGYAYAAEQLAVKLALTLMLVFGLVLSRSLLLRSLALRQRRLAIEHARELRAAVAAGDMPNSPAAPKLDAQAARENLTEVSLQSRRLLHTTLFLAFLTGLWMIWSNVSPALQQLDAWQIWGPGWSVKTALNAGILVILFTTAVRNVPGLIEILLLERLPLDRSVRYAVGALSRYAIGVVGILMVSDALSVGWDDVQWLVAALTFGLGFGLQEIFANFISGLIILFEQPVRVGDIVTLDGVSGTVSRIRMRSTTITDWDRKDYIVPNKEFITGKVLNWTLTDGTNRVVIRVGVSYDADPEAVTRVLLGVVRSHPHLMTEPSPSVEFEGFGDSSLNFVIRVFLPTLDGRGNAAHNLHVRILAALKENGIGIPFPQRDLHLRSAPAGLNLTANPVANRTSTNGSNGKHAEPEFEDALEQT